jgi:hypothetical protein
LSCDFHWETCFLSLFVSIFCITQLLVLLWFSMFIEMFAILGAEPRASHMLGKCSPLRYIPALLLDF